MHVAVRVIDCNGQAWASDVIAGLEWVLLNAPLHGAAVYMAAGSVIHPALDMAASNAVAAGISVVAAAGSTNEGDLLLDDVMIAILHATHVQIMQSQV